MADENNWVQSVNDPDWVFYRDREEWADVEPVPQDDGPFPVVAISYTERFVDVYNYFRAVLKRQEKSERAFNLTKDALELNPANYTVWQYRRMLLKHLNKDLWKELNYTRSMIEANEKNYQVWHHRRVIVEWLQNPSQELTLTKTILASDAKNYHAWQYRQWVVKTFCLFEDELNYVEQLLDEDVRNNSAWNHRYFVISNTTQFPTNVLEREVDFVLEKIKLVTCNESAWNYLRGLMTHCLIDSDTYERVCKFCINLYENANHSPFLLAYMVDICEESNQCNSNKSFFNVSLALKLCDMLANKYDIIRCQYWLYISRTISQKFPRNEEPMVS